MDLVALPGSTSSWRRRQATRGPTSRTRSSPPSPPPPLPSLTRAKLQLAFHLRPLDTSLRTPPVEVEASTTPFSLFFCFVFSSFVRHPPRPPHFRRTDGTPSPATLSVLLPPPRTDTVKKNGPSKVPLAHGLGVGVRVGELGARGEIGLPVPTLVGLVNGSGGCLPPGFARLAVNGVSFRVVHPPWSMALTPA